MADKDRSGTWAPLAHRTFRWLWIASVVSNIGHWVQEVGLAWLMVDLTTSPLLVALLSTAAALPIFLLSIPAGALADVIDRRRLLLAAQTWMLLSALGLLAAYLAGVATAYLLLAFAFTMGIGAALTNPAWQAIIPDLVPKKDLANAVTLGGININISRAVGPALAGLLIAWAGPAAAFAFNALSFILILVVLALWRQRERDTPRYPETFGHAVVSGLRFVRHDADVQRVLFRSFLFILGASALWALMPLVLRSQHGFSPLQFGLLMGAIGTGALTGAGLLPRLRRLLPHDRLPRAATILFALGTVGLALLPSFALLAIDLYLAGVAWICMMATNNLAAQSTSPRWVRGRVLSIFLLVFQGTLAAGGVLWGTIATFASPTIALLGSALVLGVGLPLTFLVQLPRTTPDELEATKHWPAPELADQWPSQEPAAVSVEYRIRTADKKPFLDAMRTIREQRLRNGGTSWMLLHAPTDASDVGMYTELFRVPSWAEHMRQHERGTVRERDEETLARSFHTGPEPPKVTHYLLIDPARALRRPRRTEGPRP